MISPKGRYVHSLFICTWLLFFAICAGYGWYFDRDMTRLYAFIACMLLFSICQEYVDLRRELCGKRVVIGIKDDEAVESDDPS